MSKQEDARRRYLAAAHAVQSGVAMELEHDPSSGTPKHLRTGLNLAMVEHGALVQLLVNKGIITEAEYLDALAAGVEDEQRAYEERLTERLGSKTKIRLG